jgi:hypothetical protein
VRRAGADGLPFAILNPAHMIGRYDARNWGRMFRMLDAGTLPGAPRLLRDSRVEPVQRVRKPRHCARRHACKRSDLILLRDQAAHHLPLGREPAP